jgi:phosphate transport system substrate-binding protein
MEPEEKQKAEMFLSFAGGCGSSAPDSAETPKAVRKTVIANAGSDTMVNIAQMWAESYGTVAQDVSVEVSGGGTGVGIRDLMQGITQIANCSREIEPTERDQAKKNTGKDPVELVVGHDAIAVYVHKDNPMEEVTIAQLVEIFGEGGKVDKWSQLGVDPAKIDGNDEIVRVSRQNSSGTYLYFRDHVLNKQDFKAGSRDMSGSKDVVELVTRTKSAIGYSGMGYSTKDVKMLRIKQNDGAEAIAPTIEHVLDKKYPLARSLLMYTLGAPEGAVKAYLDWILSPDGQKIVVEAGYVPEKPMAAQDK